MSSKEPWAEIDLGDLVEHLREGLQVVGPDYRYLYVNPTAAAHGQRPREELVGRTMMECYPGIEETEMFGHVERLMSEGGTHSVENEFRFPDGSVGWFELRMTRVSQGVMVLSIDVTERKKLEAQVRRIQRMDAIGQLSGGVAHDFNNILTIIQAYGRFILDELPEDTPMHEDARCVLDAAQRGADLTQRLLTFAREAPVSPVTLSVVDAMPQLGEMLRRTLGEQVVLAVHVDEDVGEVTIDPTAFDQLLINLVVNARDAVAEGGRVTIEAQRIDLDETWSAGRGASLPPGRYAVVSVTDDGKGIPPDQLERVFEPFYTTKSAGRGTGLGLATCWGLVEQAGGTITVYSEVDNGTTFRVYLPEAKERVAAREHRAPESLDGRGENVLVVEDQAQVRELMVRVLRDRGYRVVDAASAAEALLFAEDVGERLRLLITDVVMPRMSGLELADRLRRRFPAIRVLLVSGFTPRSLAHNGLYDADAPMLAKPFTPAQLAAAARAAIDDEG